MNYKNSGLDSGFTPETNKLKFYINSQFKLSLNLNENNIQFSNIYPQDFYKNLLQTPLISVKDCKPLNYLKKLLPGEDFRINALVIVSEVFFGIYRFYR